MLFGIVPTVLLLLSVTLAHAAECPAEYLALSDKHTYCLPPNKECSIAKKGVTDKDKELILKIHNDYRSKVANGKESKAGGLPTASNMMEMEWDDEIAAIAQKLAETCKFGHDCNKCRSVKAFSVGQNIGKSMGMGEAPEDGGWKSFLDRLYNEVSQFDKKYIKPFVSNSYGHFTQMVWAKSYKVGCGWTAYKNGDKYESLQVCNYGPAGNMIGGEMYKEGPTGESCKKKSTKYKGLCSTFNINEYSVPFGASPQLVEIRQVSAQDRKMPKKRSAIDY